MREDVPPTDPRDGRRHFRFYPIPPGRGRGCCGLGCAHLYLKGVAMINLLKWMPVMLKVFTRAKVLVSATESRTTKAQVMVAFPVALCVALLGYMIPDLASDAVAFALVSAIIGFVGPLVSRYVAYKDTGPALNNWNVRVVGVRKDKAAAWKQCNKILLEAYVTDYYEAYDAEGNVYDVQTGEIIDVIKVKPGTQQDSDERMAAIVDAVKNHAAEKN